MFSFRFLPYLPWFPFFVSLIGDSFDFTFLLMKVAREIDADIEPHTFLLEEFNDENPVVAKILKTGQKVL
jgi:hypothetical protein